MKNSAVVKFHAEGYHNSKKLLKSFEKAFKDVPGIQFQSAQIHGNGDDCCIDLALNSLTGFLIQVTGLTPGNMLVDLLSFCGFTFDDETKLTLLTNSNAKLLLLKEK